MITVTIDGINYVEEPKSIAPPKNEIRATHWAVLPDESVVYYRVKNDVLIWLPLSEIWSKPGTVPYTLYAFDDYA